MMLEVFWKGDEELFGYLVVDDVCVVFVEVIEVCRVVGEMFDNWLVLIECVLIFDV